MFDEINVIGDMLRNYNMEESKKTNPSVIANKHEEMDDVPSDVPLKPRTSRPKLRSTTKSIVANESTVADNLSTETIIEMTTTDGGKKNILGLLDTGAISKIGAFIKRDALTSIPHTIRQVDGRIQG
eukprot:13067263-Ditylum_brightwellii.AAC.1